MPTLGFGNTPASRMKTYRIQHESSKTDFLTTDFTDIWNETDKLPDGDTLTITVQEMTAKEYEETIRERGILNLSIKIPWEDGSSKT